MNTAQKTLTAIIAMTMLLATIAGALAISSTDFTRLYKFEGDRLDIVNGAGANDIMEGFPHNYVLGAFQGSGQGAYAGFDSIPTNSEPVKTISFWYKSSNNICAGGYDTLFEYDNFSIQIIVEGGYGALNDECRLIASDFEGKQTDFNLTEVGFVEGTLNHYLIVVNETEPNATHIYVDGTLLNGYNTGSGWANITDFFNTLPVNMFTSHNDNNAVLDEIGFINKTANASEATTLATTEFYQIPQILSFTANDTTITLGDSVEFCWDITGDDNFYHYITSPAPTNYVVMFDEYPYPTFPDTGCVIFQPNQTATYTLTGANENGTALSTYSTGDITINVFNPCDISNINNDTTMTTSCELNDLTFNGAYKLDCAGYTLNLTTGADGIDTNGNNVNPQNCQLNLPNAQRVYADGSFFNTITFNNTNINTNAILRGDWIGMNQHFNNVTYLPTIATSFEGGDETQIIDSNMNFANDGRWASDNTPYQVIRSRINYNGFDAIALIEGSGDLKIIDSNLTTTNNLTDGIVFWGGNGCQITRSRITLQDTTGFPIACGTGQNSTTNDFSNNQVNFGTSQNNGMIFGTGDYINAVPFTFQNNTFDGTYLKWGISLNGHDTLINGNVFNYSVKENEAHLAFNPRLNNTLGNNTYPAGLKLAFQLADNSYIDLNGLTTGLTMDETNGAGFFGINKTHNMTINNAEITSLYLNLINSTGNSNPLVKVEFATPVTFTNVETGTAINASNKKIYIDENQIPDVALALATITFYETGINSAEQVRITKNGAPYTTYTNLNVNNGIVSFSVQGFSTYELIPQIVNYTSNDVPAIIYDGVGKGLVGFASVATIIGILIIIGVGIKIYNKTKR